MLCCLYAFVQAVDSCGWCAYSHPDSFRCQPTKHFTLMSGTQKPCCDLACMSSTSSDSTCEHQSNTHLLTHPIKPISHSMKVSVNHHGKLYCSNGQLHATHCTTQVEACVCMLSHQLACSGLHLSDISYPWVLVSRLTQLTAPGNLHAQVYLEANQFTLKLTRFKLVVQVKHQRQVNAKLLPCL